MPTWQRRPVHCALEAVAEHYGVPRRSLVEPRGVEAKQRRHIVMWLARAQGATGAHIAYYLGMDRNAVRAGCARVESGRSADPAFMALCDHLLAAAGEKGGKNGENYKTPAEIVDMQGRESVDAMRRSYGL